MLVSSVIQEQIDLSDKWKNQDIERSKVSALVDTASSASRYNQLWAESSFNTKQEPLSNWGEDLSDWARLKVGAFSDPVTFSQLEEANSNVPAFTHLRVRLISFLSDVLPLQGYPNPQQGEVLKVNDQVCFRC